MKTVIEQSRATIPSPKGDFVMVAYSENEEQKMPHLAIMHPDVDVSKPVHLRIHSECLTGDIFQSMRCDCGDQLNLALDIAAETNGIVLYLRQEGRGIGLIEKLKAYELQDTGLNTYDANVALGHNPDARDYTVAVEMLDALGIKQVRLMTNNPDKEDFLNEHGIEVVERLPLIIPTNEKNQGYMDTKKEKFNHYL